MTTLERADFARECDRRREAGFVLAIPFMAHKVRRHAKDNLGAIFDDKKKTWLFPTQDAKDRAASLVEQFERGESFSVDNANAVRTLGLAMNACAQCAENARERAKLADERERLTLQLEAERSERDRLGSKLTDEVQRLTLERDSLKRQLAERAGTIDASALAERIAAHVRREVASALAASEAPKPGRSDAQKMQRFDLPTLTPEDERVLESGDPDAGTPSGATHVTGTCRGCGKFGMVRTHTRLHDGCVLKDAQVRPVACQNTILRPCAACGAPETDATSGHNPGCGILEAVKAGKVKLNGVTPAPKGETLEAFADRFLATPEGRKFDQATKVLAPKPAPAPAPAPEPAKVTPAPAPSVGSGLKKCPKCRRLVFGDHSCTK